MSQITGQFPMKRYWAECMLDKLSFNPIKNLTSDLACQLLEGKFSSYFITKSNHYNQVTVFYKGALKRSPTLLALHTEPRNSIAGDTKIELNPTHFDSYSSLMRTLEPMLNSNKAKITRIDYAVDIDIPIEVLNRQLLVKRKRVRTEFDEGKELTGVYYGKQPELFCIYDKAYKENKTGPLTRVELRQFKHKIPIKTLEELPLLMDYSPFSKLSFVTTKNSNELSNRDRMKASFLRETISTMGATGAVKLLNVHHNFERYYKSILSNESEIPNLDHIFQINLKRFFKED